MMKKAEDKFWELRELVEKALDGSISQEESFRLNYFIINNPDLRQYYCEYIQMSVQLMKLCDYAPLTGVEEYDKFYFEALWNALVQEEKEAVTEIRTEPEESLEGEKKEEPKVPTRKSNRLSLYVAAACFMIIFFMVGFAQVYQVLFPHEVATIDTMLNAAFAEEQPMEPPVRLTNRKEPYLLQSGLIEMVFDDGAKVLLEGPATFRLESKNRMILRSGQLFATVLDSAQGFTVDTPISEIVDMGTEFGIMVEGDGTSDLHMFKGKASLTSRSDGGAEQNLTLTVGQAKRVTSSRQVKDIPINEQGFVRQFYSETGFIWRGQKLSLVDIAGKGNGLGTGERNIYIDPVAGYTISPYSTGNDNQYYKLDDNPFVDGLFVPDGKDIQIVSSQGHEFVDCPETNGECYTTIGVNPVRGVWGGGSRSGIIAFTELQYEYKSHPYLAMHANLGITYDLQAIRNMCPDIQITQFVSKVGIADFEEPSGCNADFWVLVDGQVRAQYLNVTRKNVLKDILIELKPSDRFLTLVTTDGGDIDRLGDYQRSYTCDWCVFIEPMLVLETEEIQKVK